MQCITTVFKYYIIGTLLLFFCSEILVKYPNLDLVFGHFQYCKRDLAYEFKILLSFVFILTKLANLCLVIH